MVQSVYVEAYGCSASLADSEMIMGLLQKSDFQLANSPEEADVNVIVTCTVKTVTSQRMSNRIQSLTNLAKPLVVAGCMPKTERSIIEKINPLATLLGPNTVDKAVDAVSAALRGERAILIEDSKAPKVGLPRFRVNPVVGVVEISTGCLSSCTFCQVKIAKGVLRSFPPTDIVKEVEQSVAEGCNEIWLTSTDNSCYGREIGSSLPELLQMVCDVPGNFFVRVGMMNPLLTRKIIDELLEVYRNPRIFKFLHIPVQSGSNRILKLMRRGYTVEDFYQMVSRARELFPDITISTDIIVGFPSETDEDFRETVELVTKSRPSVVNLSRYGARPGTVAAEMSQLSVMAVKRRSNNLHGIIKEVQLENNKRWIGWTGEALIDEEVKGAMVARNFAYKPIVIKGKVPIGRIVRAQVTGVTSSCLTAVPV